MKPATTPRASSSIRVLVSAPGGIRVARGGELASLFCPGDVLVVNDAATLPATIDARTAEGEPVEIRLLSAQDERGAFTAALLGRGDHTTRTEDRPPPPRVRTGERLFARADARVFAEVRDVSPISPRLVDVRFSAGGDDAASIWAALYRVGRPVQYAHVPNRLALWDVQNAYASRPWALEMPSAGRVLRGETMLALRRAGVVVARVTHAAGISSTGDAAIDALLPLPERFHVPWETARAVNDARRRGGRVIAVGTSVVRALESAVSQDRASVVAATEGVTDLRLSPASKRRVVDALLTGVHERDTTHFALLGAFASPRRLDDAMDRAAREGLLGHEFGDEWLLWGERDGDEAATATFPVACGCAWSATLPAA